MIFAQPVNPRGLSPGYGLGQFVVDPTVACRAAILHGTMGDVGLLMFAAGGIYREINLSLLAISAPGSVRKTFTQKLDQITAVIDETQQFAANLPAKSLFENRVDQLCAMITQAQAAGIQFKAHANVNAALDKLFETAAGVQSRIEAATRPVPPSPEDNGNGKSSIIVPALLTGALLAVVGAAYYVYRRNR